MARTTARNANGCDVERLEPRRLFAAAPVPVADLGISDVPAPYDTNTAGAAVGDVFYFARQADTRVGPDRLYLWRSDGTPAGTTQVAWLTGASYQASNFFDFNGTLYFALNDGSAVQLWKSDGTEAGTVMLKDLTGPAFPSPPDLSFTPVGDTLYFVSNGLWRTDGTSVNTHLVSASPAFAQSLADVDGTLYFLTGDGLWRSDGTPAGTARVATLEQAFYSPSPIARLGDAVYFVRDGDLYRSDGTAAGTALLHRSAARLLRSELVAVGGRLVFPSSGVGSGTELFVSDGTPERTAMLKDVRAGGSSSGPGQFTAVGDTVYFTANDGEHGLELWKTDGTVDGTTLVKDIDPGPAGSSPQKLTAHGSRLYFSAADPSVGRELFVSDGTDTGTRPVAALIPGDGGSMPSLIVPGPSTELLFTALHPAHGYSAFLLDTAAEPAAPAFLADLIPGVLNRRTPIAGTDTGTVYYADGDTRATGREPYVVGPGGTALLARDIEPGVAGSDPQNFLPLGPQVLFRAATAAGGPEVWRADGATVEMLRDGIPPGVDLPSVLIQGPFGDRAFINYAYTVPPSPGVINSTFVTERWVTQGTGETTTRLAGTALGPLVEMGDWLYYLANATPTAVLNRISRDGATGQTVKRVPDRPASNPGSIVARDLRAVGDLLYFSVVDAAGRELWRSDGTAAGTAMVKDLAPGAASSSPSGFTQLRGSIAVFVASADAFQGVDAELWRTDGTAAGTVRVKDVRPGTAGSNPRELVHYNGAVYFTADDGSGGRELWKTDGTAAGTVPVADLWPGAPGSDPAELKVFDGKLYFAAAGPEGGRELWSTDGTAAGTVRVADLNSGPGSSSPMNLTDVHGDLYFTANDGTGAKLYRMAATAAAVAGRLVFYNNSRFDAQTPGASLFDDGAIAAEKHALLPGQTATFANFTSYSRGVNGVMIDLAGRPSSRRLGPEDFEVRVGNGGDRSTWTVGPAPSSVTVRRGAGASGTDRITLIWPDGAIRNTWVEVTAKAGWATGLDQPDVFYFGNAIGATGGFSVSGLDVLAVRRRLSSSASRNSLLDFDRNGAIDVRDLLLARLSLRNGVRLSVLSLPTAV